MKSTNKERKIIEREKLEKIGHIKETFCAKMDMIKDRNGRDLTKAEDNKKRWQEELYQKELYQRNYTRKI